MTSLCLTAVPSLLTVNPAKAKADIMCACSIPVVVIGSTYKCRFWVVNSYRSSIQLKKRIGLLRRIKKRVPKEKNIIIAEAIFNSLLRYGVAVFLKPIYDKEDLNMEKTQKILLPFKHYRTIC